MWQSEIKDFDMANCIDENCNSIANCIPGAQFGCGHFTQQIWKSTTHFCYQARDIICENEPRMSGPDMRYAKIMVI